MLLNVFSTGLYTSIFIPSLFFVFSPLYRFLLHNILLIITRCRYIKIKRNKRKGRRIKRRNFLIENGFVGTGIVGEEVLGANVVGHVEFVDGVSAEVVGTEIVGAEVVGAEVMLKGWICCCVGWFGELMNGVIEGSFENCLKYSAPVWHDSLCSLDKLAALQCSLE